MSPSTAPEAPADPPAKLPAQYFVLLGCSFCVALGYGILAPVLPVLAASYGVSVAAVGAVVSAFALCRLLFATTASKLVSLRGETVVYIAGLLVVALSTLASAFAPNYGWLVVLRGVGGVGSVMFTIAATGLMIRMVPAALRGRASAAFGGSFLAGNIVGPSLGGLIANLGLKAPFFIYAGMLFIAASMMTGAALIKRHRALGAPAPAAPAAEPLSFGEAFKDPRYKAVMTGALANGMAVFGIRMAIFPLLAIMVAGRASVGWDPLDSLSGTALTGLTLTAFALGTLCVLPIAGRLTDTLGRSLPGIVGLAGVAASFVVIGLAPNGLVLVLASLVGGVFEAIYSPSMQAALADVVGTRRGGSALAAPQMAADIGVIVGPVAGGFLADSAGFSTAFIAVAAIPALASLIWIWARARYSAEQPVRAGAEQIRF